MHAAASDGSPSASTIRIELAGRTTLRTLDSLIEPLHHARDDAPAKLLVDLSETQFILLECLPALIAEIRARHRRGFATLIRLPKTRYIFEFLQEWGFWDALQQTCGIPFNDFVIQEDLLLLSEFQTARQKSERYYGADEKWVIRGEEYRVPIKSRRFWSFRYWDTASFRVASDPSRFKRAVLDESERWSEDPVVREILVRHLGKFHPYVSSHVVHEAMSNAFRHGRAQSVLSVSQGDFDKKAQRDRLLTIVFWDDGIPAYRTLRDRLNRNLGIKGSAYDSSPELKYALRYNGSDRLSSSKELPVHGATDAELMLATIFPGVSSDPEGNEHFTHPDLGANGESEIVLPGRGLANLINGAIDVLHGEVTFRCGEYFLGVEAPNRKNANSNYKTTLENRHPFNGNLITIRLPLQADAV
jgi:hypothetical protein